MLERYRVTMGKEIVYSWAEDAQNKIDALSEQLTRLRLTLESTYAASPEGRKALEDIDKALSL